MELFPKGRLQLNYLRGSYPFQLQPQIELPDISVNALMGNAAALSSMKVDGLSCCEYPKPLFIPHDQSLNLDGAPFTPQDNDAYLNIELPKWIWDTVTVEDGNDDESLIELQYYRAKTYANQTLDVIWDSRNIPDQAYVLFDKILGTPQEQEDDETDGEFKERQRQNATIHGFVALVSRSIYNRIPPYSQPYYDIRAEIGDRLYSLYITNAQYATLRYSTDDGTTWETISESVQVGGNPADTMGSKPPDRGRNPIAIEFIVMNRDLKVMVGGNAPYVYRIPELSGEPEMTRVQAEARVFTQFNCEIHPVKFATLGQRLSNLQSLGFSPANTPRYRVSGLGDFQILESAEDWEVSWPEGSIIRVTQAGLSTDIDQQYLLEIENEYSGTYSGVDYADKTAAVTRVSIVVDGIFAVVPTVARNVMPKRICETTRFDPNRLTIDQSLNFTLDNYYGQWRGQSGNIAVHLETGYAQPSTAYYSRFTGMCGDYEFDRPETGKGTVTFLCKSLMKMLSDQPLFTVPTMDGWNHYYAVAHCAQQAGISVAQMAFAAMIPSDPFSASGWDPAPYFLPIGAGNRPWTPRDREMKALELIDYIRKPSGFLLYFDAQGYLHYEPWLPFSPATHVAVYTEGSNEGLLTEYFSLKLTCSMEQVRNQVILGGVDPSDPNWRLIFTKAEDSNSIYASPGLEPMNYIGYKKPMVWADSRFADVAYATEGAARLLALLRVPGLEVTFETFMQPALYPMDVIFVDEHKSGTEGVPFYVIGTTTNWSVSEGGRHTCRTHISGKFLVA